MSRGRLITIEGVDGAGKSTLAVALRDALAARGFDVELLREPGGVQASERIRDLVKDPTLTIGPRAEALLYAAARAQLVSERLEPALAEGSWILLDRFVDSSLAYQGAGRGLGVDQVAAINAFATGAVAADRTLLLRVSPAVAATRQDTRGEAPDRLELEAGSFFARVAEGYERLAAEQPQRVRPIDADQPTERVLEAALRELADLLS